MYLMMDKIGKPVSSVGGERIKRIKGDIGWMEAILLRNASRTMQTRYSLVFDERARNEFGRTLKTLYEMNG